MRILISLALALLSLQLTAQRTLIHAGRLIFGTSDKLLTEKTIVV